MKKIRLLAMVLLVVMMFTGCQRSLSYGYKMQSGDIVIVKCDLTKGYSMQADQAGGTFQIMDKENNLILDGFLVEKEMYDKYLNVIQGEGCTIIPAKEKEGITVTQYQYVSEKATENNFICWINGGKTGVVIASMSSQEEAEAAFDCITIKLD